MIWGYGVEGKATEEFIRTHCEVNVLEIFEGSEEEIYFSEYDYIVKSPGIPCKSSYKQLVSQTSLFLEEFRNQVIGVTGTKGKSTTSSLLYHTLEQCGKEVLLVGNIGLPCLARYDDITKDSIIVFELSCHQLRDVTCSPHIAVYLNLYEDHLDYYGTMESYHNAKSNIILYQEKDDYSYVGENVPSISAKSRVESMVYKVEELIIDVLQGEHNQYNARVVQIMLEKHFHIAIEKSREAMNTFRGLSHRLEYIDTIEGIKYYDDSISTICQSAIQAVESVERAGSVLIGGMDRGIDYSDLIEFMKTNETVLFICMYESGRRIYEEVRECTNVYYVEGLEEAVKLAKEVTPKGSACILSPAAASYGYFKNFEERGNCFKELVRC